MDKIFKQKQLIARLFIDIFIYSSVIFLKS